MSENLRGDFFFTHAVYLHAADESSRRAALYLADRRCFYTA